MSAILETKGLKKTYQNHLVLDGINFTLNKGEVAVILGPSGCGKSTFLKCLNGLEKIDEGEILFENTNLNTPTTNWNQMRQKIGMVFQNYELFPHLNALDNILLAPLKVQKRSKDEVISQATELLKRVGLEHKQQAYPKELSGGQKQRVAIVRSLCMQPKIMLFDEVTASLDPEMVKEVLEVILELATTGMSMVIVTHEMKFAQKIASKIVFFDSGKIAEENNAKEFFNHPKSQRAQKFLETFHFLGSC
ncbi:amino acid ABC transporter ATP-binding protein [Helicobacter pylori]|uniref:amino acid ABC transporter ATP-binding protein n=1 Tax=Helicobacter pylori TaxID=210 RepID=UPI0013F3EDB6|nr:amino acid ABC transporter ATP-binding protein [Helicobacter pylori]NHB21682.1 amino acid ABC transporter ATP-binding protein [Helicobacter pylori]NHB48595.1 amino acid ABC transporter ATP-binding protein [Helicobacter pylori]WRG59505.1 amino acid ABC transporter ATP-binding protein [Helicobacter pylori]